MKIKYIYFLFALLITGLTACKKTIDYEPIAQNRITSYKVVNLQDTVIYGVVDNIQNTVTVYVPYYYGMSVIQPQITVSPNATLTAQAQPVSISDSTQTYTVKGADGSTKTYKLSIIQQNTPSLTLHWFDAVPVTNPFQPVPIIYGDFLSTSTSTLKVTLTSRTSKQSVQAEIASAGLLTNFISSAPGAYSLTNANVPLNADSGFYDVNVSFLGHSVTMDKPLHVIYNIPAIAPSYDARTIVQGGTTTFLPITNPYIFIDLKSVKVIAKGISYDLPIQSWTRQQAVITIPANFPAGDFGTVTFSFQFGNWAPVTSDVHLIITPK